MRFCHDMLQETVTLLSDKKLPYKNSILIGDNASGKSEALRRYMNNVDGICYFIDAVNRSFDVRAVKLFEDDIVYKDSIVKNRLKDEYYNLKDSWAYYGTPTECIEMLYFNFENELQKILKKYFSVDFVIQDRQMREVKYSSGDIGRLSSGYQACIRMLLELLYFNNTVIALGCKEKPVVVIDEIDEYLSPVNAGKFYFLLKKEFSNLTFVLTTHSADVIAVASECNILVMHEDYVEVLDASDFRDIDEAMYIFKEVFGSTQTDQDNKYEACLRKLFNNRLSGIWGEAEQKQYDAIKKEELTKAESVLYRQIGEW